MANSTATPSGFTLEEDENHDQVLRTFRCLVADLVQQFDGGHPGGAMSMAAIGIALYKYAIRFSPLNPKYPNKDHSCFQMAIPVSGSTFSCIGPASAP